MTFLKSRYPAKEDYGVTLDAEGLAYNDKGEEYEHRVGSGSPVAVTLKDDGAMGTSFMGSLLTPLLMQSIVGYASLDVPSVALIRQSRHGFPDKGSNFDIGRRGASSQCRKILTQQQQ